MSQKRLFRGSVFARWPALRWRRGGVTSKHLGSDPWGPRALLAPDPDLSPALGRPLAEERLELRRLPTAQLCSWFSSMAKPGLARLFLGLSQGITLLSLFWEKEAFWSVGALWSTWLVLGRALGCSCGRAGGTNRRRRRLLRACTHTHVHSPGKWRGIDPGGKSLLF